MTYLDSAATSMQKPQAVFDAVHQAMETCASVGRSGHEAAKRAAERVYLCRELAAELFDASPEQVVFTSNATHGLNIAIHSLVRSGDRVVVSGFEHNAVVRPLYHIGAEVAVAGKKLFDPKDTVDDFIRNITPDTKAVICNHVSNVFGYILPVEKIAEICYERGVPFVLDASQSAGTLPVSLRKLRAAFIAMPGHKGLCGPQGTGILLCGMQPLPIMQGGTGSRSSDYAMPEFLPDRIEVGTHNVPGISGLAEGLSYVIRLGTGKILEHEQVLVRLACSELNGRCRVFRGDPEVHSGVVSLQFFELDCEEAAELFARQGIAVRAGLHCAPLAHRSAGTLDDGTLRISFSSFTSEQDLEIFFAALNKVIVP